jgi:MerR family transcriptional regulator, mercuric resistance operon regulatory protein
VTQLLTALLGASLQRGMEPQFLHGLDQLIHAHPRGVERDARLLVAEAHLRRTHALEPFQGSLDRQRSHASRHAADRQHDRRRCSQHHVHHQEKNHRGQPERSRHHGVRFRSMSFMPCPAALCSSPSDSRARRSDVTSGTGRGRRRSPPRGLDQPCSDYRFKRFFMSLTIGALSEHSGCNIETIRYYERIRLMPYPPRSEGGHRLYGEDHVKRLGFIRRSRELGFTLDQIRTLLRLVDGGRYTCAQVKRITVEHLDEVERKVADLRKIERVLKDMAAQCDGGTVPECAVIDALFDRASGWSPRPARGSAGLTLRAATQGRPGRVGAISTSAASRARAHRRRPSPGSG